MYNSNMGSLIQNTPPIAQNYLRCLLLGGGEFSNRGKGLLILVVLTNQKVVKTTCSVLQGDPSFPLASWFVGGSHVMSVVNPG